MTHEEDEGDVCRVCRSGPEPGSPLFHPCKCSGSIRFVHQDCLLTWLQSSRRKYCELCGHSFSFTRVYDPSMPAQLPPLTFVLRLGRQALKLFVLGLRSCLVALTWLGLVPWLTIWAFRLYFVLGNGIAWSLSGQGRSLHRPFDSSNVTEAINASSTNLTEALVANLTTSSPSASNSSSFFTSTLFQPKTNFFTQSLLIKVAKDTFEGQILTASIVISFLAAFLLREWTLQAPPRNEEEEEVAEPEVQGPAERLAVMQPFLPVQGGAVQVVQVDLPPHIAAALRADPLPGDHFGDHDGENFPDRDDSGSGESVHGPDYRSGNESPGHESVYFGSDHDDEVVQEPTDYEALRRAREKYFGRLPPSREEEKSDEDRQERIPTSLSPTAIKHRQLRKRRAASSSSSESSSIPKFEPVASTSTSDDLLASPSFRGRRRFQASPKPPRTPQLDETASQALADVLDLRPPIFDFGDPAPELEAQQPFDSPPAGSFTFRATPPHPQPAQLPSSPLQYSIPSDSPPLLPVGGPGPSSFASHQPRPPTPPRPRPRGLEPSWRRKYIGGGSSDDEEAVPVIASERVPDEDEDQPTRGFRGAIAPLPRRGSAGHARNDAEDEDDEAEEDEREAEEDDADDGPPPLVDPLPLAAIFRQPGQGEEDEDEDGDDGDVLRDDELEAQNARLLEEDLDGIMDAIGLRGPILGLLQNSTLIVFVLSLALSLTVFFPFTLGKTLLLLNYLDVLKALRLPVRAVRFFTDPVLRVAHLVGSRYILPPLDFALLPLIQVAQSFLPPKPEVAADTVTKASSFSTLLTSAQEKLFIGLALAEEGLERVLGSASSDVATEVAPSPVWSFIVSRAPIVKVLASAANSIGKDLGDLFAQVGTASRISVEFVKDVVEGRIDNVSFAALAQGDSQTDRFFATWVGYATIILALLLWFGTSSDKKGWTKATREVFKSNAIVLKLAFFMSIELLVFPLACGILLDFCLLPLFHERTGLARAAFHVRAPYISVFLHWVGGTLFMFAFAQLLSHGRKQLRKGTFFFIRDPQDPTFQPVREIIERPALSQIHKLGASAVMYFFVIFVSVGMTLNAIRWTLPGVLPLLWKPSQPLAQIPIDLLALHFIAPPAMKVLRPHRRFRKMIEKWWAYSVDQLRLGSYFFDKPVEVIDFKTEAEEDTPVRLALDRVAKVVARFTKKEAMKGEGGLVRVPNSDTLSLTAGRRVFIRLDRRFRPVDEEERALLAAQDRKTVADGRNPADDFCFVYLPPFIRARVFILLFSIWISLVVLVGAFLSLPLVIGRYFFSVILNKEIHDGYSFAAGATIALCTFLVSRSLLRKIRRWGQAERVRRTSLLGRIKRNLVWGFRVGALALAFGLVLPLAVSLVFELYLISPMKDGFKFEDPPVLFVWELWAIGLLWMHVIWSLRRFLPGPHTALKRTLDRFIHHLTHLQIDILSRDIIVPILGLCTSLVVLPFLLVLVGNPLFSTPEKRPMQARMVYPFVAATVFTGFLLHFVAEKLTIWRVKLRDSEFLIELRLRNLDPNTGHPSPPTADSRPLPAAVVPDHLIL